MKNVLDYREIFTMTNDADRVLEGAVVRTPLLLRREGLLLKAENLQRAGSFKFRGAYYSIATASREVRERGVVAYSTGNHAQAVALAASMLGVKATVVMSHDALPDKIERTRRYGASIVFAEESSAARKSTAERLAAEQGRALVPPYEDAKVIAAQGTIALEILSTLPGCGTIVVPVGGGGLIAGIALYAKTVNPSIRIVGAEPAGADDACRSFRSGEIVANDVTSTICDGLSVQRLGSLNFDIIRACVDDIVPVNDVETMRAVRRLLMDEKILVEPSGAISVAAVEAGLVPKGEGPTVAVLSGGNMPPERVVEALVRFSE